MLQPSPGPTLVKAVVQFCWTMWHVLDLKRGWSTAPMTDILQTVITIRMLVFDAPQQHVKLCATYTHNYTRMHNVTCDTAAWLDNEEAIISMCKVHGEIFYHGSTYRQLFVHYNSGINSVL